MKTWKRDIFDHLSHLKLHLFSLKKRKMGDFNHVRITGTGMIGQSKMHILYL
jgi:hypothetical protein